MNTKEKNQAYLFYVGVDLSKEKFDAVILNGSKDPQHHIFINRKSGIKRFISWLEKQEDFNLIGYPLIAS